MDCGDAIHNPQSEIHNNMRILVHDYAGHPFQVQLSRALARRGHDVLHVFSGSNLTPQGALKKTDDDPAGFDVQPIVLAQQIQKGNLVKRRGQEIDHGRRVVAKIGEFRPDAVISANSPLDAQIHIQAACKRAKVPHVFWLQDLNGVATHLLLKDKIPVAGALAGRYYMRLEERLLRASDAVVAISQDFAELLKPMGLREDAVHVIQNWAPLPDVPVMPKANAWSAAKGLDQTFNFVYSGTLGMKHNPGLLLALANAFKDRPDVRMVVISEGPGRKWLEANKGDAANLLLMDYQPFKDVPLVLGSADVVVAILDPGAGVISVPSKVSTYMCASRAMVLAVPGANLASRLVQSHEMGLVANPEDAPAFVAAAERLYADASLRERMGANARAYAEREFDVETISGRFEAIFRSLVASRA